MPRAKSRLPLQRRALARVGKIPVPIPGLEGRIRVHQRLAITLAEAGYGPKAIAQKLLESQAADAAADWVRASAIASKDGNHVPAKDLLLHARLIEPVQDKAQTGIQILIGQVGTVGVLPGMPGAKALGTAPEMVQIGDTNSASVVEPSTCEDGST